MKSYEEMNEVEYAEAVTEYADTLASLADGWTTEDVLNDMKECIGRGGDGFLETMTDEQLKAFAASVMRKMN